MNNENIKHFDFYDMRDACRKYKENNTFCTTNEVKDGN